MTIKKIIYFTVILFAAFIGCAVQARGAVRRVARSSSGQFSNANNFKSAMQSSVDPRTGTLSCSMVVGQLHSNWGKGPFYKLALSYTSGSSANPDGIGHGWQWNLSHYNVNTHSLTTDQGRTFLLVKKADGTWGLRYHKIKDIVLTGSPQTGLIVTLKTGVREYFSPEGYVTKIESEMGEWITFHYMYEGNKALLTRISDEKGRNIQIKRADGMIYVSSLNDTGQFSTITITTSNNKVHRIILPSPAPSIPSLQAKKINHPNYAIRFSYDHNFLTKINYPTGAENDYLYSFQTGAKEVLKLLANGTTYSAPVVIEHIQKPNAGTMQGARVITYKYGSANRNHHDYLAFGSVKPAIPSSNHDVLFDTRASYTYRTVVDNGQTKDVRIYNKYHLMIKEVKINDQTNQRLSETQHYYCDPNDLNACNHFTFAQLPNAYVLPLKVVQKVWSSLQPAAKPMVLISKATYDNEGNTVRMTDHYGRMSQITYCPIKGDASCPASPAGWPFVNLIESTVYTGASKHQLGMSDHKNNMLSATNSSVILHNIYNKIPNRLGKGYALKLQKRTLSFGGKTISTHYDYFLNKKNIATYGMPKKEHITNARTEKALFSGLSTFGINEMNINVDYVNMKKGLTASTGTITNPLNAMKIRHMLPTKIRSAYTGMLLEKIAPDETSSMTYRYDHWDRMIATDIYEGRANTPHAKLMGSMQVHYVVSPSLNEKIIVHADGSQKKTVYDGLGRPIAMYIQAAHKGHLLPITNKHGTTRADGWQLLITNAYDAYGHLVDIKKHAGLDGQGDPIVLDTHKYYSTSGVLTRVTHTDGTAVHYVYAENELCAARYKTDREGRINQVAIANFNQIKKMIRNVTYPEGVVVPNPNNIEKLCQLGYNADHKGLVSTYLYDGFGRLRQMIDSEGHKVIKIYDTQGHLTDSVDPKGNKTHYTYNMLGKITSKTLEPIGGGVYPLAVYKYNVMGQLVEKFIEGAIGKGSTLHPFYRYTYNVRGSLTQVTTPNNHVMTRRYDDFNRLIEKDIDGIRSIKLSYNKNNQIMRRIDASGTYLFSYNPMGALTSVHHQGNAQYPSYTLHWRYNDYGQIIAKTDINGDVSYPVQDALGRTASVYYVAHNHSSPQLIQHVQYDSFGRPTTLLNGNGLTRKLTYNPLGRVTRVQDTMEHHVAYAWKMTYDSLGNIVQKNTIDGHGGHSIKNYHYDTLSNLTDFACTSSGATNLCPRDTDIAHSGLAAPPIIAHQHYTFTTLNTLSSVEEKLYTLKHATRTFSKVTHYHYNSEAYGPLRLKNYSIQWNTQASVTSNTFVYDNDGNMIVDGKGEHMTYNATDQMLSYTNIQGKVFHYTYDGLNREISEHYNGITNTIFYDPSGNRLNEQRTQGATTHTMGYFGSMETIDSAPSQYLESNYKGDVIQVWGASSSGHHILTTNVYSPYGMTYALLKNTAAPLTKNAIGFDGQRTDPGTKWQMLGNGHRAYNPVLRHFMTEDPILEGYTFGSHNPIMNIDPSGNISKNLAKALNYFQIISIYIANIGLGAAYTATAVEAKKHPHRKSLQIAKKVLGITASVAMVAAGVVLMFVVPIAGAAATVFAFAMAVTTAVCSVITIVASSLATIAGAAAAFTHGEVSKILGYISLGLQAVAIVAGIIGFGVGGGIGGVLFLVKKITSGVSIAAEGVAAAPESVVGALDSVAASTEGESSAATGTGETGTALANNTVETEGAGAEGAAKGESAEAVKQQTTKPKDYAIAEVEGTKFIRGRVAGDQFMSGGTDQMIEVFENMEDLIAAKTSITETRRLDYLEIENPVILHPTWAKAELSPGALGWINGRYSVGMKMVGDSVWLFR